MENQTSYNNGVIRNSNSYYMHSGKFSPVGIILMLLFGIIGAVILGAIYGYAILYISFVYINIFIAFFYGFGVGSIVGFAGKIGKVRNTKLVCIFGVIAGIIAEYTNWVFWSMALTAKSGYGHLLLLNPADLLTEMKILAVKGIWSIKDFTPTGVELYIIWIIEAGIIILTSILGSRTIISDKPFCEDCNCWVKNKYVFDNLKYIENLNEVRQNCEASNLEGIKGLEKVNSNMNHTTIQLLYCDKCRNYFLLNVDVVVYVINNRKKNPEKKTIHFIKNLIINKSMFDEILSSYQG